MSLCQALSAAFEGVSAIQKASVVAANVANSGTPGYTEETVNQSRSPSGGQAGTGVDVAGVNRQLNTMVQSQLRTEIPAAPMRIR